MNTLAPTINKYLNAIFDTDDPVYRALIADDTGTPTDPAVTTDDMNVGAIGNMLEWNRRLSISLLKQLYFDLCEGIFLDFMVNKFLGFVKNAGETVSEYKERVADIIFGPKISPAAVIYNARPYSTEEPVIVVGDWDTAYADASYADCYDSFQLESPPAYEDIWVMPAISRNVRGMAYFFVLYLTNTDSSQLPLVLDKISQIIAAGIIFEVHIFTTS